MSLTARVKMTLVLVAALAVLAGGYGQAQADYPIGGGTCALSCLQMRTQLCGVRYPECTGDSTSGACVGYVTCMDLAWEQCCLRWN